MKAQTGFTALVASAAVVSAAPGAIRQGSVARTVEKPAHPAPAPAPAPIYEPMYPTNCTVTGQNCTQTPGGHHGYHGQHGPPEPGHAAQGPETKGGIFKFLSRMLEGLLGGGEKHEKRAEPVFVL